MLSGCCATSHGRGIDISSPPLKSASRLQTRSVCATSCGREADCRVLAELRHAPYTAADPTELRVRRQAHPLPPSQRAFASDARGRRSGRRPGVCLVLSSSAGARCAVVSSNATLFPPLEHSAGRTRRRSASQARWRGASGQPVTLTMALTYELDKKDSPVTTGERRWPLMLVLVVRCRRRRGSRERHAFRGHPAVARGGAVWRDGSSLKPVPASAR